MKQVFEKINQLSYPAVFFIASFLTLIAVLPLWLYISRQQTQLVSKAAQKTIPAPILKTKLINGPVPVNAPVITRVYPWIGKPGDTIVIEGMNFGVYPKNRRLAIGGQVTADALISSWTDTRIEAVIPDNAHQGEPVSLRIDTYPITESVPLIFYTKETNLKLRKQNMDITLEGTTDAVKAVLYTQQGTREIQIPANTRDSQLGTRNSELFTLSPGETIQSLILTNKNGTPIPYSINPTEFGF